MCAPLVLSIVVQPGLSQMTKHMLLRSHPFYELWRGVRARGDELHLLEKEAFDYNESQTSCAWDLPT
ncbi:hypothetical protein Y1Q_0010359 [Alligator mississippiensis]|uniref:Uncharacterized protein n=1 Tax=Alligator mississippiensis TaxID=8496 RepID=A0A151NM89_ALLMI|nr:hypothetical protein Y1Q_0010359 [Alligator mississippiensis]